MSTIANNSTQSIAAALSEATLALSIQEESPMPTTDVVQWCTDNENDIRALHSSAEETDIFTV